MARGRKSSAPKGFKFGGARGGRGGGSARKTVAAARGSFRNISRKSPGGSTNSMKPH